MKLLRENDWFYLGGDENFEVSWNFNSIPEQLGETLLTPDLKLVQDEDRRGKRLKLNYLKRRGFWITIGIWRKNNNQEVDKQNEEN